MIWWGVLSAIFLLSLIVLLSFIIWRAFQSMQRAVSEQGKVASEALVIVNKLTALMSSRDPLTYQMVVSNMDPLAASLQSNGEMIVDHESDGEEDEDLVRNAERALADELQLDDN